MCVIKKLKAEGEKHNALYTRNKKSFMLLAFSFKL
jgi:hypothetical protein